MIIQNLKLEAITVEAQDRTVFDEQRIAELACSIELQGVLNPILVRPINGSGAYHLIAGERRYRAAKSLQMKTIPCNVQEMDDETAAMARLSENLQREDLHPLDESKSYQRLIELDMKVEDIALKTGKPKNHVQQILRLQNLVEPAKDLFRKSKLELGHAKVLMDLHQDIQEKSIKAISTHHGDFHYFKTTGDLIVYINQSIKRSLSKALFDIESKTLHKKFGSCVGCPFNSSNTPGLFGTVNEDSVCTQPVCYDEKVIRTIKKRNKDLMKLHGKKEEDLVEITTDSWTWGKKLGRDRYERVKLDDENRNDIVLGVCNERHGSDWMDIVYEIRLTKKKKEKPELVTDGAAVPLVVEKPHEEYERKQKARREKHSHLDEHDARDTVIQYITHHDAPELTQWETARSFIDFYMNDSNVVRLVNDLCNLRVEHPAYNTGKIREHIWTLSISEIHQLQRAALAEKHRRAETKHIAIMSITGNTLRNHASAIGVDYGAILKDQKALRDEKYAEEDATLKRMKETARKREVKALEYVLSAKADDAILYKVLQRKKRFEFLKTQDKDYLVDLSRKLGSKTKKEATNHWYAGVLLARIIEIEALMPKTEPKAKPAVKPKTKVPVKRAKRGVRSTSRKTKAVS